MGTVLVTAGTCMGWHKASAGACHGPRGISEEPQGAGACLWKTPMSHRLSPGDSHEPRGVPEGPQFPSAALEILREIKNQMLQELP